jgi:CheY-like chemotaxis protein
VLILEDEKVVARDLQRILGTMGYETSMAASGEEAIDVARRDQPDLALVDIHLAGKLDGIETVFALRRQAYLGVVYLTAHADEQTLERAKATEPSGYLVKPFDEATLRATLQMAVHRCGIERGGRIDQGLRTAVPDQLTGLPCRAQAEAVFQELRHERSKHFAALFVVDRYGVMARKYGTGTADEVLAYYGAFLVREVPCCKRLFRWTGPCFLAVYGPLDSLQTAQRETNPRSHARLEKEFQLGAVTVLLPVSGSVEVFSIDDKPLDMMISQIDSVVAIRTRSQQH